MRRRSTSINTASGSGATLADTYAYDVKVTPAPQSDTLEIVLIVVAAAVVALAIAGVLIWCRRRSRTGHAAHGTAAP
jgi:hypothetical protein